MPFGLSNVPVVFMFPMNGLFREHMDKIVTMFLEYISIYSKSEEENEKYLRMVLQVLREHKLYAKTSAYFIKRRFTTWGILFQ